MCTVHCTVYILNILMINHGKDKKVVRKYKGKGGCSAEGLEHTLLKSCLYEDIVKIKFIHKIQFFLQIYYLNILVQSYHYTTLHTLL